MIFSFIQNNINSLAKIGRIFFSIALIAWGVENFIFGDFIAGRAPAWSSAIPGQFVWAYCSGAAQIIFAVAIIRNYKGRTASLLIAAMIFLWAALRHLPEVVVDSSIGGAWTNAGKAFAFTGGTLLVAASLQNNAENVFNKIFSNKRLIVVGRVFVGAFIAVSGVQHFLFPEFVRTLVPSWIPGDLFWTYAAGAGLFATGVSFISGIKTKLAALVFGITVFIWLIILHIPRAIAFADRNEWTAVFEALAVSGICFVLAGVLPKKATHT